MLNRLIGRARVRICLAMALVVVFGAPASARAAYDMTISTNATTNVTCSGGACTATGTPANLSAADLVNAPRQRQCRARDRHRRFAGR